jgi:Divergent InlB B-repeat domain
VTGTGILCPPDCTETYDAGTAVTLSATPIAPSTFVGWSGACSGTGSCQLTMESDRTVTALFDDPTVPSTTAPSG